MAGIPTYKPGKPASASEGPAAYKLSSNENPYPPLPGVLESTLAAAAQLNRYPDMACTTLTAELAERFGVPQEHVATGTGSVGVAQQLLQDARQRVRLAAQPLADVVAGQQQVGDVAELVGGGVLAGGAPRRPRGHPRLARLLAPRPPPRGESARSIARS